MRRIVPATLSRNQLAVRSMAAFRARARPDEVEAYDALMRLRDVSPAVSLVAGVVAAEDWRLAVTFERSMLRCDASEALAVLDFIGSPDRLKDAFLSGLVRGAMSAGKAGVFRFLSHPTAAAALRHALEEYPECVPFRPEVATRVLAWLDSSTVTPADCFEAAGLPMRDGPVRP